MRWLVLGLLAAAGLIPLCACGQDIAASPPSDVSVTIYRAPYRSSGALELDDLEGFALVSETRTVSLPVGESRVRFAGVADGIEPASTILAGLPATLLEKNRDARVLSPAALVAATVGHTVEVVRTDPKTGRQTRTVGTLRADNDGVVFQTAAGIEALRCSGLPETFQLASTMDLAPTPTLSVWVRTERPVAARMTLSYLAHSFDWSATYTATVSPDARTMDLGAWVTLANGNAVSFPQARMQIVAGRLNRVSGQVEPVAMGGGILAQCWPRGSTSDIPPPTPVLLERHMPRLRMLTVHGAAVMAAPAAAPARPVVEEQLGDLKLYRVPQRTTLGSRQMKQVRLLDRQAIPVQLLDWIGLEANQETDFAPAHQIVRTRNDAAHHLGLPLPSGLVDAFTTRDGTPLLLAEAPLRDIAMNEELEIAVGEAPDVQVRSVLEQTRIDPSRIREIPLLPGVVRLRSAEVDRVNRIEIRNARSAAVILEARLDLPDGFQLIRAAPAPIWHNGQRVFRVRVPARGTATVRYQTEHTSLIPLFR